MLRLPSKNNMGNIRELFGIEPKEKVPPDLRHALTHLQLNGYEDLEERFLCADAFIKPWAVFRDSIFVLSPDAMPRPTQVVPIGTQSKNGVSRMELLWFYTHFDEGTLRYDSRADRNSVNYTPDTSIYGQIDKSKWRVEEYEKHLYAWLLQEFKVGKAYSPWRFEYFELKNVCTVWEEVLVPIVNAVRASYNPLGRRHYGRLALYIEARCHSQLAFPSSNIGVPEGAILSPTPYRIVSVPKKTTEETAYGVLTKTNYDVAEKELRYVYPQYGGLVERPKFKHKMEEWLADQRARADRRKDNETYGNIRSYKPRMVQSNAGGMLEKELPQTPRRSHRRQSSESPIKRCSDSIKRSLSNTMSSLRIKEEPKSPLHGVTRPLHFPDRTHEGGPEGGRNSWSDSSRGSMIITPLPRPPRYSGGSDSSEYTTISELDQHAKEIADTLLAFQARRATPRFVRTPMNSQTSADTDDSIFSPMAQLSAIPRPLLSEPEVTDRIAPKSVLDAPDNTGSTQSNVLNVAKSDYGDHEKHHATLKKTSYHDVYVPSYEDSDYQQEISLTDIHTHRMISARSPEPARAKTPVTRLPAPIVPIPYSGPRVASADMPSKSTTPEAVPILSPPKPTAMPRKPVALPPKPLVASPKPIEWPGPPETLPKVTPWPNSPTPMVWPGADSDDEEVTPPLPTKSPERQIRNPRSRLPLREDNEHEVFRIVSRENIRTALGGLSRESSTEELAPPKPGLEPVRTMIPMQQQLQTYNTHMFPRKDERRGTPVGGWIKGGGDEGRVEAGGSYELQAMESDKKEEL
jgi:hypothetical protein